MIVMKKDDRIGRFERFKRLRYRPTNRPTDQPTDKASYRDADVSKKSDLACAEQKLLKIITMNRGSKIYSSRSSIWVQPHPSSSNILEVRIK